MPPTREGRLKENDRAMLPFSSFCATFALNKTHCVMKKLFLTIVMLSAALLVAQAQIGDLPRSAPVAQGLHPVAVERFVDSLLALPETEIHHLLVARHGHVVAEVHPAPFRAQDAHTLYSASKTFVALAVGLAIADNRLRLDDRVAALMHDCLPDTVSDALAQMTVRHLLTMSSGITPDWALRNHTTDWERAWLAKPVGTPGQQLLYDSMCTYLLSAIVQRVTSKTVMQLLNERLFAPMHITEADWQLSPSGVCTGGWGLRIQAESLAKVGIMMLQRGQWEGRQLVPEWWIDEMTQRHINYAGADIQTPTDGNRGYGYQVWRCKWATAYRADGALGQYMVMDPATDMVVVILGVSRRGHDELACIWNLLMPGVGESGKPSARASASGAYTPSASLALPNGKQRSPQMTSADIKLQANKHDIDLIKIYPDDTRQTMRIYYCDGRDESVPLGYGAWRYGSLTGVPTYSIAARGRFTGLKHDFVTAAAYAWTTPGVLTITVHYVNFISATTLVVDLDGGTITITDNFDPAHTETIACAIVKQ